MFVNKNPFLWRNMCNVYSNFYIKDVRFCAENAIYAIILATKEQKNRIFCDRILKNMRVRGLYGKL